MVFDVETKPVEHRQETGPSAAQRGPSKSRAAKLRYRSARRAQQFSRDLISNCPSRCLPSVDQLIWNKCTGKDRAGPTVPLSIRVQPPGQLIGEHAARNKSFPTAFFPGGRHPPCKTAPVADSQRSLTRCSKRALARIAKGGGLPRASEGILS